MTAMFQPNTGAPSLGELEAQIVALRKKLTSFETKPTDRKEDDLRRLIGEAFLELHRLEEHLTEYIDAMYYDVLKRTRGNT